ncbi:SRPBCC family protein [Actinoplanes sp. TBRC 11911]|uniref:SRPBCC family protein n=1 Tax=Actinoplanes sp. TBRC 11911 TaxID=2729386 RepID=UPI00145C4736|nr:SRPBCC family protein [Actinoplanes sp. TBRC 11911]NMO55449.1 SRPBCC family protein [Actinoplanes sp. TBRC 11911]
MSFDPGPVGDATLEDWTLVFVRELRHAPDVVWQALTDPAELDQWAPFRAAADLAKPGDTTLTMIDGDTMMDMPARVLVADPPTLLEYTWGDDRLRWTLEPSEAGTRLILRHTLATRGMEAMVAAGWHICVAVLARLLDGDPVGVIRGSDAMAYGFERLRDGYAEKFGR